MQGKKQSESTKKKIGEANAIANKGKKLTDSHTDTCSCSWCRTSRGDSSHIDIEKRTRLSKEAIEKRISEKGHWSKDYCGEKHWAWTGGFKPYSRDWTNSLREHIREKYNRTCFICKLHESNTKSKLSVHHIDYNKNNCLENNLVPLCKPCHTKTNFNREQWKEYFYNALLVHK